MPNPLYLVWLGSALMLVFGLHYTFSTVRAPSSADAQPKPNPVSWGIWSLSGWLAFLGQISEGVRNEALLTLCVATVPTFIFSAALVSRRRYGAYAPISRLDITCGGLAIVTLAAWRITASGTVAIALSIVCDALVAIPVIRQAYRDPSSDSPSIWVAGAVNAIITLATFRSFTFLAAGFALYFLGLCLLVSFLLVALPRLRRAIGLLPAKHPTPAGPDAAAAAIGDKAAAFAGAFAADYLTWDDADPHRRAAALTAYIDGVADAMWGWSGRGWQRADLVLLEGVELAPDDYYIVNVRVRVTFAGQHAEKPLVMATAAATALPCDVANGEVTLEIPLPNSPRSKALQNPANENRWFRLQIPVVVRHGQFCIPT